MKSRILIVDDSKFQRVLMKDIVESGGFEVVDLAKDGLEALDIFKKKSADLVLLDITMPNMSGKKCLEELKKIDPNVKVIMISALKGSDLEQECQALGASAFIGKLVTDGQDEFKSRVLTTIEKIAA